MDKASRIMIIDDDSDYRFTMETFLNRNGFETLTAENGQEGLGLIEKEHPDLILLDVMMQTTYSGLEICKTAAIESRPQGYSHHRHLRHGEGVRCQS